MMCFWTGLGIWCSLKQDMLVGNHRFFLGKGVQEGTAAGMYIEQLSGIVKPHLDEVMAHMDPKYLNPYGLRKGSATFAVSGTTAPPSLPAIARRGEWSIGSVLDVYWHFASVGDQYLGRILAGFDPTSSRFDTLPPHWKIDNPLTNGNIRVGMDMTFGKKLLLDCPNP